MLRGARGASEGTPRLVGFRDENDAFVGRSSHQEVTHYCQENQNGDPVRNRASIVVPLAYHGVVGVDRTLIPAKMKDKFIKNTGRAWRLMRAACLAFPLNHFVVALRLLPRTFGGVDAGIIQDSSVTYDPVTTTAAGGGFFFPPGASPSDRDALQTATILHDLADTKHAAIRAASQAENTGESHFPYPLLRSYDDMGAIARRCVLVIVLLVMQNVLILLLRRPYQASLAWRVQALSRLEYVSLAYIVINENANDHWMAHHRQLRTLLVALCVLRVVGPHIRNILKERRESGDINPRRRVLELGTHLLRTLQVFDRTCWWKIPASSVTAFDKTVEILGYLYGSEFGLGGDGLSSRFPSAANLEPSVDPAADPLAANRVVRREIDFDPAKTRIIISIRVSDPRSLVDVEKRDKASSQQLLTAAMALRDMRESSGVRASVGEFVVHVATGSKRRHEDAYFVAFAPHPGGHLHRALVSLIEGEDVDAARRNFEAGAAAAEAKTRLADAERVLRNLSGDASEATRNATHARDACARATTDSARATEQLRLVGNQYDVDWNLLHGEAFAGITQPIIASEPPSDPNPNASTTFVFGRGYADFIRKVDHLLDNREPYSSSAIVLFAVAWLDRIPPRAMEALRSNGRLPVAAFSSAETAAIFRKDPRTFTCPITGGARLADVDLEHDGSAARYHDEQSRFTLAMRDFLESFASAASFGTMEWASFPIRTMTVGQLNERDTSIIKSYIREMHARLQGDASEDAPARFAIAFNRAPVPVPDDPNRRLPRRLIGVTRRSGAIERFKWQMRKLSGIVEATHTRFGVVYESATTFALDCVGGAVPVEKVRRGVRVRHHRARRVGERVKLFANLENMDDLAIRDAHDPWKVEDAYDGAWILRAIEDANDDERNRRENARRDAPPPADVAFPSVSRICNPGTIKALARYVKRTKARVFDCVIFRALMFDDVDDVDAERARLREFLLNGDGSIKLDEPKVEGFLTFLSLQSVSWRFAQKVTRPFWKER